MKSRIRQMFTGVVLAAIMSVFLPVWTFTSYAADGRIAFSDETASVGSEIEVKMKVTVNGGGNLNNATLMLSYDSSMLEFLSGIGASGGAGSIRVTVGGDTADAKELSSVLKFKAIQAGTSKISVNTEEVYDSSNQVVTVSKMGSSTITVQAPANASTEAALSDLKVSPGTLTPEFSPDVFVYSASVEEDVTKITVNAPAKDEKASVVLSGNEDLKPGENQVVCRVVAEDGATVKEYIITVTRAGDGSQTGEAAEGSLAVETPAKTVTIIPLDEGVSIPAGFAECTIKIDGQDVQGWIWATDTEHKYCVFYGMNEAGEKDFYRYDLAEKTMQRYFQDPAIETNVTMDEYAALAEQHNSLLEDYKLRMYIIAGLGAVAVLLFIIILVLMASRRKRHDDDDDDDEYTNYEEKLNNRREVVKRASEGLPSQRAKAQAERMTSEQRQVVEARRLKEEQDLQQRPAKRREDDEVDEERSAGVRTQEQEVSDRADTPAAGDKNVDPRSSTFAQGAATTYVPKPIVSVAAVQRPPAAQQKEKEAQQKETRQERLARQAQARAARQAEQQEAERVPESRSARRAEPRASRLTEEESLKQPEGRTGRQKKRAARQAEAEALRQKDLWSELQAEEEPVKEPETKASRQAERRAARKAEAEARAARLAEEEARAARRAEAEARAARQAEIEAEERAARLAESEARAARLAEEEARQYEEEQARQAERRQARRSENERDWEAEARSMWQEEPETVEKTADRYVWPTVSEPLWQPEPEPAPAPVQPRQNDRYQVEEDDDGFEIIDLD